MKLTSKSNLVLLLLAELVFVAPSAHAELVANGSFDSGFSGWSDSCLAGVGGDCGSGTNAGWFSGTSVFYGYDNDGYSTLSQTLATNIGQAYELNFDHITTSTSFNQLSYGVDGFASSTFAVSPADYVWQHATYTFTATSAATTLAFFYQTDSGTGTIGIDGVSVIATPAVPEPEAYALAAAGLAVAGLFARRRKQA